MSQDIKALIEEKRKQTGAMFDQEEFCDNTQAGPSVRREL